MPITTKTKTLKLDDAKVAKLTADDAGSLTYASLTDVEGAIEFAITPVVDSRELKGDNQVLDIYSKVGAVEFSLKNAKIPLDVLGIMLGGTVTASGTTPNQKQTYDQINTDNCPYFKAEGQSKYGDAGDTHVVLQKAKITAIEGIGFGDDYAYLTAKGKAIPTINNGKLFQVVINETATAIA